ncbi:MAG TPA: VWA domain-containing protein [Pyrinomonadaceae bacterium]|jgi:VWFA-related protein|nr:VWA domain-containing protein [Pyrinomonadaceae bacterium]
MKPLIFSRRRIFCALALVLALALCTAGNLRSFAQSRRQPPVSNQKKNKRPAEGTQPSPQSGGQQQEELPPDLVGKPQEAETIKVSTAVVNVDAVVYDKKSKQIITSLKKENFAIFEDGVKKEITNFSTPEAPITVAMVLEYSKLTDRLSGDYYEAGRYEVIRPMAMFLTEFIKPPDDYVSVIAFDIRPTPLTDFTNDPRRLSQVINLLLRSNPAFTETNLFDALKFTLVGGRGDAVVLDRSESRTAEYDGMASLQGRRRAVILVCSGLDTFSKINYDQARKVAQNAGVPIYVIGTGNLFLKKYEERLSPTDGNLGSITPGRLSFLQAQNALKTFAKETGGMYFPVTFQGELPSVLQTINAVLRSQYSLGYNPGDVRDGKQHKIVVKVDVNGDGQYDDKEYVVQSRQYYNAPKG